MTAAMKTQRPTPVAASQAGSVELTRVTKSYGSSLAVDDLSLRIEAGEFVSLLGPSGCGKTTILRMIGGFEQPDHGSITIAGQHVTGTPPHKRNVNTVFQAYALFPHMTIAQNVAYGLQQRRTPKSEVLQRVSEALDMVQMRRFADRKPTQLSGGQQQRVALARALVNRPAVLLLDEPLAALDRQLREAMQLELKQLQSELGITFIFVTHDQGEALSMSDRIAVMRSGRIEQMADPDTVYNNPSTAYVAGFIGQQNFFYGSMSADGFLHTDFGLFHAEPPGHYAATPRSRAVGAVRPEFIHIAAAGHRPGLDEQLIAGRLISAAHLGETIQFVVELPHGATMVVRRPAPLSPVLAPGDNVVCWWPRCCAQIFPADQLDIDGLLVANANATTGKDLDHE